MNSHKKLLNKSVLIALIVTIVLVDIPVLINNGLDILHMRQNTPQLSTGMFRPNLITRIIIVLPSLMLSLLLLLHLLTLYRALIIKFIFQTMSVLIGAVEQVIHSHEYLAEI